jgi:TPR repeat protein
VIPDALLAADWFYKASEQMPLAQYALGKLYLSESDDVRNPKLGMEWLEYAAEHGSHCAAYRAGKEYLRGEFAKRDVSKAVSYLDSAACDGNSYAQYLLGKLYLEGREIHQNKETARYWLTQSTNQGNGYAQFLLDHIDSVQPPSVLLAATHLLHNMANIFRDNSLPKTGNIGFRIDKKRLQKLRDKRIALGHKPDDHEESQWPSMSM